MSADDQDLSALRENIEKKGKNSYYYAHGLKIDGPEWDGKEEPRLLDNSSAANSDAATPTARAVTSIREYSWGDGKKIVTIYVDFEKAGEVGEERYDVQTTSDTVTFSIVDFNGKDYKLYIDKLNSEVESASVKVKEGQFKVILRKKEESPWFQLKK
jgi:hypothetical protein